MVAGCECRQLSELVSLRNSFLFRLRRLGEVGARGGRLGWDACVKFFLPFFFCSLCGGVVRWPRVGPLSSGMPAKCFSTIFFTSLTSTSPTTVSTALFG